MKINTKIIKGIALTAVVAIIAIIGYSFFQSRKVADGIITEIASPYIPQIPHPCNGNPASSVELGFPIMGGRFAEFNADGEVFVTARKFEHGGLLEREQGSTVIHIGSIANPPSLDSQRGIVYNAIDNLSVREGDYGKITLPSGRYWLWSGIGSDILVVSCNSNGVSDPKPVR